MKRKHQKILDDIRRVRRINWSDALTLVETLGGRVETKRKGSRVLFILRGSRIVLHKPHGKEMMVGAVRDLKKFLEKVEIL